MNKKQLIKALESYPDHMDIYLATHPTSALSYLNEVESKVVTFTSEHDKDISAKEKVIILRPL